MNKRRKNLILFIIGTVTIALIFFIFTSNKHENNEQSIKNNINLDKPNNINHYGGFQLINRSKLKLDIANQNNNNDLLYIKNNELPIQVVIYTDYICPACKLFEIKYGDHLFNLLDDKKITLEYRILSILNNHSLDRYSSRAANASFCIMNYDPNSFITYHNFLIKNQPKKGEKTEDQKFIEYAKNIHSNSKEIETCIINNKYIPFIDYINGYMKSEGINSTPSVYVNGDYYDPKKYKENVVAYINAYINKIVESKF